jgi:hypothetical protein
LPCDIIFDIAISSSALGVHNRNFYLFHLCIFRASYANVVSCRWGKILVEQFHNLHSLVKGIRFLKKWNLSYDKTIKIRNWYWKLQNFYYMQWWFIDGSTFYKCNKIWQKKKIFLPDYYFLFFQKFKHNYLGCIFSVH